MSCTVSTKLSESAESIMELLAETKCYPGETLADAETIRASRENRWQSTSSILFPVLSARACDSSLHTTTQCDQCG
jgi:hypothetical protein